METLRHLERLRTFVEKRNFEGYDPYDGLNSPFLRAIGRMGKWGRIVGVQAVRRLPINIRPLLMIAPGHNPKALGLFLDGYARLHRQTPRDEYLHVAASLVKHLKALRTPTRSGWGWGYNFDWQSRAFFLPKFTPTVVCSAFVANALLDAAEVFGFDEARELAYPVADFFVHDLHRIKEGDSFCFSYSPIDRYGVHNASLLGGALLIRMHKIVGKPGLRDAALSSLDYSVRHQRDDGSWYYSEAKVGRWVDSFHTGFNLESMRRFLIGGEGTNYVGAYHRGVQFYANHFFQPDGAPIYFPKQRFPIDVHCAAEAISFFADEGPRYAALLDRVLQWTFRNLADSRGFFYYQRGRYLKNRIPYMRWGQAWMFRALAASLAPNRCYCETTGSDFRDHD